ncbi:zinc finger, C3HC4 type [Teladorsagia circumcincta]|uniref:Zinc finger, C3HC4 type n=1 Tax=Teladorsagia circumcincta TaxID=45464 RepID=A0A2G9UIA2_TELCI|nr:zinc finger, C3HC4 type [Teladorsagia circumcincta]
MSYEIVFKGGLPEDCTCPLCEQALRAPVITQCGHSFCKECIDLSENGPTTCPVCQTEISPDSLTPDKQKQLQVQSLLVKCPFARYGCKWCDALKEMQNHADSCQHHGVPCPNCNKTVAECNMATHLGECQMKVGKCAYCDILIKATSMEKHLKICPKMIISCPFQCGLTDRTREESFHTSMQSEWCEMNERHQDLLQRAITANEMYGAQMIWRIDNMKQKMNEARSGTQPIIHSDPFVSGRYGYKFIASACLFGDGQNRGKYIAVYVTLVRGKYDALLQWPFDLTVCITMLDQNPNWEKRCDISYRVDARKITEKSEFLERPSVDRNGWFGAQTFCRLAIMDSFIRDDVMFLKFEIEKVKSRELVLKPSSVRNLGNPSYYELPPRTPATIPKTEMQPPKTAEEATPRNYTLAETLPEQLNEPSQQRPPTRQMSAPKPPTSPQIHNLRPPSSSQPAAVPVIVTEENEIEENAEYRKRRPSTAS